MSASHRFRALPPTQCRGSWIAAALLLATTPSALAGTITVPGGAATIQQGIDAAAPGDTVLVAAGTYNELIDLKGKALTLQSADPTDPTVVAATIISGVGLNGPVVSCVSGEGPDTLLAGFTITGGNGLITIAADPRGGGLRCVDSSPTVRACVFERNQVGPYNGWPMGGGMFVDGGQPTVVDCQFRGNAALAVGGPAFPSASGGGLAVFAGGARVQNCLFVGNRAGGGSFDGGGGLYVAWTAPPVRVVQSVFVANQLETIFSSGGGVLGGAAIENCIAWGNDGEQIANLPSAPVTVSYSDVQGGLAGTGNIDADPLFGRFPDPGPDLVWGSADDDYGDLRLTPGSPVIDAGNNAAVPAGLLSDLDGQPRRHDDPGTPDTGSGTPPLVDMGPYEFQGSSFCGPTLAEATAYGLGKPGSNGVPTLCSSSPPVPGQLADLTIAGGLPLSDPVSQPLVLLVGQAPASLPFDGGSLLALPELVLNLGLGLDAAGGATIPVALPPNPGHCGKKLYFQVLLFADPGATGFLQSAQSNGLEWILGSG